jgi:hypothetical protein
VGFFGFYWAGFLLPTLAIMSVWLQSPKTMLFSQMQIRITTASYPVKEYDDAD